MIIRIFTLWMDLYCDLGNKCLFNHIHVFLRAYIIMQNIVFCYHYTYKEFVNHGSLALFKIFFSTLLIRLPTMRKIRPKRKHATSVRNPLKTTSVEIKTEYEEVKFGYAELEIRRKQKEKRKEKNTWFIFTFIPYTVSEKFTESENKSCFDLKPILLPTVLSCTCGSWLWYEHFFKLIVTRHLSLLFLYSCRQSRVCRGCSGRVGQQGELCQGRSA